MSIVVIANSSIITYIHRFYIADIAYVYTDPILLIHVITLIAYTLTLIAYILTSSQFLLVP